MPRPKPSVDADDRSVQYTTAAKTYTLPKDLFDRLRDEFGFRTAGIGGLAGAAELEREIDFQNRALTAEGVPSSERNRDVYERIERQAEGFLRTGGGRDSLVQVVEEFQVNYFGGIFRQREFDLDGLLDALEDSETDSAKLRALLQNFVVVLRDGIDAATAAARGRGRRPRSMRHKAIQRFREIFRDHGPPLSEERPDRGGLDALSSYEALEVEFVAMALSQCPGIPGVFYVSDDGKDADKEWRRTLLREFRKMSCQPGQFKA